MKYYIIFGPPGAGKGTQSEPLSRDYNLYHISTGDLLRSEIAAGTELGKKAAALIDEGNFVPDEVVEGMIVGKFNSVSGVDGFLLDGFPRTLEQARDFDALLSSRGESVTAVLSLMIPDSLVHERIRLRAEREGRADDTSDEIVCNRIRTYHEKTEPLIAYYKSQGKYHEIDSDGGPGEEGKARVYARLKAVVDLIN